VAEKVVIFSYSDIKTDPRVLRQIGVLQDQFNVNILVVGCGTAPPNLEFVQIPVPGTFPRYLGYLIRNKKLRQKYFFERYLTQELRDEVRTANLVIANEIEFLPLVNDLIEKNQALYVDLHEHHLAGIYSGPLERLAFANFKRWQLNHLAVMSKRRKIQMVSSVSEEISACYSEWLGGLAVETILNSTAKPPEGKKKNSKPSRSERLKFVHHGMGRKNRGIELIVRTLAKLPMSISIHLLVRTSWVYRSKILLLARLLGVQDRIVFERPVAYEKLISKLMDFDVSLVPGSDRTQHDLFALPNKLFESLQAGLPLVVGPNPSVRRIVEKFGIGSVASDWSVDALRVAILEVVAGLKVSLYTEALEKASEELSPLREEVKLARLFGTELGLSPS